jgi:riboflavin synthase
MFTGIVEEVGRIAAIRKRGSSLQIALHAQLVHEDARLGDSIAVNGVCLTVTHLRGNELCFDVVPETFRNTGLARLQVGSAVNLERAMAANGRFGGHVVSGHVDTVGSIESLQKEDNAVVVEIRPQLSDCLRYVVPRGSVTLDGISLTVNEVYAQSFRVSIIPHTFANTVLQQKKIGDWVNIEVDIIGKYVERLLGFAGDSQHARPYTATAAKIDKDYLIKHGFMG